MQNLRWLLLSCMLFSDAALLKAKDLPRKPDQVLTAKAFELEQKKLIYKEKHHLFFGKNQQIQRSITHYLSEKDQLIAYMDSDYSKSLAMPVYIFKDLRSGYEEGLSLQGKDYFIFTKEPKEQKKSQKLDDKNNVYSCQGWHYYILQNIEKVKNEAIELRLILPSRLDHYGFKIEKTGMEGSILALNLSFSNWFLRALAPSMDLRYDLKSKRLLSYKGPSNLLNSDQEMQFVEVVYD